MMKFVLMIIAITVLAASALANEQAVALNMTVPGLDVETIGAVSKRIFNLEQPRPLQACDELTFSRGDIGPDPGKSPQLRMTSSTRRSSGRAAQYCREAHAEHDANFL